MQKSVCIGHRNRNDKNIIRCRGRLSDMRNGIVTLKRYFCRVAVNVKTDRLKPYGFFHLATPKPIPSPIKWVSAKTGQQHVFVDFRILRFRFFSSFDHNDVLCYSAVQRYAVGKKYDRNGKMIFDLYVRSARSRWLWIHSERVDESVCANSSARNRNETKNTRAKRSSDGETALHECVYKPFKFHGLVLTYVILHRVHAERTVLAARGRQLVAVMIISRPWRNEILITRVKTCGETHGRGQPRFVTL